MARSIGEVNAKLTLDKSQFSSANKEAQAESSATERALSEAAKRTAAAQSTAAKYAADTVTEQGRKIRQARADEKQAGKDITDLSKALQRGYIEEKAGADALTAAIQRQLEARKAIAALTKTESHTHDISDRQAASATIRAAEGTGGIRAVETFTTMIPGAAAAMQTLFPIIGAAGLAGLLYHMGEEGLEAFQKIQKSAENTREAFQIVDDGTRKAGISLDLESDKLQLVIAKLEHKPANFLRLALDEDRKATSDLITEVIRAQGEIDKLFKENGVSLSQSAASGLLGGLKSVANFFTGSGKAWGTPDRFDTRTIMSTDLDEKFAKDQSKSIELSDRAAQERVDKASTAAEQRAAKMLNRSKQIQALDLAIGDTEKRLDNVNALAAAHPDSNYSARQAGLEGLLRERKDERYNLQKGFDVSDERTRADKDQRAKEDATQAAEARRKAAETQLKGFEESLNKRKQTEQLGVVDEIRFWEAMLVPAQRYAENVQKINDKLGPLNQRYYEELNRLATKAVEDQKKATAEITRQDNELLEMMTRWEQQSDAAADAQAKLADTNRKNSEGMADWTRSQEVATGALSRHDAAMQLMAEHSAQYAAQLAEIDAQQDRLNQRSTLDPEQRASAQARIDQERASISGQRDRQLAADQLGVQQSTPLGSLTEQLSRFKAEALDTTNVLSQLTMNGIGRLNSAALSALVDPKHAGHDFKEAGKGIFTDIAGAGLKGLEGMGLKALGIGSKADGSRSNPFSVEIVGGTGAPNFADLLSKSGSSEGMDGGGLAGLGKSLFSMLPGFATGGYVGAGTMAMVGEHGPEPVFFGDQARVMSNRDMRQAIGGGGGGNVIHVDARGAHDPAAVSAAARQGAQAGAVAGRAMANQDRSESKRRQMGMGRK